MERSEFKKRMQSLKSYREQNPDKGYWDWRASLPDNLRYTDDNEYDMRAAYESGAQPELYDDGYYHLPTRHSGTGKILKKSIHPTYWEGLAVDAELDYNPYFFGKDTYTWNDKDGPFVPWQGVEQFQDGGEVPPSDYQGSNEPVNVNPFTKKPLANGSITPILDLEDASNFTPMGDILSIRDAYIAAKNKDLLGLGLAGLGFMPFVPTVNRKATQDLMDKAIRQSEKSKQVIDDFYTQRNDVYESMIENEDAFRRAAKADRQAGTDYVGTYGQAIRDYLRDPSQYNDDLPSMRFDRDLYGTNIKMQVDPSRPGYITVNPRYKDPDELDDNFKRINPGLVRHEMGHQTDLKAGLQYTDKLADPKNFVSDDKLKEMFPRSYNRFKSTVLNKGSEIKSYMNEFREFLMDQRQWEPRESVNTFRKKLDRYGKQFPTLRMIFDSYKSKSDFVRDYNTVPITSTGTDKTIV